MVHLSELMVMAPPNTSMAFSLQANRHGAWDGGWQFIQNKVGVSTFGVCWQLPQVVHVVQFPVLNIIFYSSKTSLALAWLVITWTKLPFPLLSGSYSPAILARYFSWFLALTFSGSATVIALLVHALIHAGPSSLSAQRSHFSATFDWKVIAPNGQIITHNPQPIHFSASTPSSLMASVGQIFIHGALSQCWHTME